MNAMLFVAMWHQASAGKSWVGRRMTVHYTASHHYKLILTLIDFSTSVLVATDSRSEVGSCSFRLSSSETHHHTVRHFYLFPFIPTSTLLHRNTSSFTEVASEEMFLPCHLHTGTSSLPRKQSVLFCTESFRSSLTACRKYLHTLSRQWRSSYEWVPGHLLVSLLLASAWSSFPRRHCYSIEFRLIILFFAGRSNPCIYNITVA